MLYNLDVVSFSSARAFKIKADDIPIYPPDSTISRRPEPTGQSIKRCAIERSHHSFATEASRRRIISAMKSLARISAAKHATASHIP